MVSHKVKTMRTYSIWNWIVRLHKIRDLRKKAITYAKEFQLVESGNVGGSTSSPLPSNSILVRSQSMQSQAPLLQRSRLNTLGSRDDHDNQQGGSHAIPTFQDDGGSEIIFTDFTTFT